jgi:hypothetical protein
LRWRTAWLAAPRNLFSFSIVCLVLPYNQSIGY